MLQNVYHLGSIPYEFNWKKKKKSSLNRLLKSLTKIHKTNEFLSLP